MSIIKIDESYPLDIQKVDEEETAEIRKYFKNDYKKFVVRVGPSGYFFSDGILDCALPIYNTIVRTDDIFIVGIPRSGNTWTGELVWMVANNFDYAKLNAENMLIRFPLLEAALLRYDKQNLQKTLTDYPELANEIKYSHAPMTEILSKSPSPRFIKTHLPLCMLPPNLLEKAKVVYVARDPRDVVVSYYHFRKSMPVIGFDGDLKTYWNFYKRNMITCLPHFAHLKEAWARKDHPNMLFLFYEELSKDLAGTIRRVAKFLNKEVTEEQVAGLCDYLSFDNFKKNDSVNFAVWERVGLLRSTQEFVRRGKVGGWRDYFDEEITKEMEEWIADNLRGTDIKFPRC